MTMGQSRTSWSWYFHTPVKDKYRNVLPVLDEMGQGRTSWSLYFHTPVILKSIGYSRILAFSKGSKGQACP